MAAESDEEFARQLQTEFDAEEAVYQQQVMMDARLAASVAKAHDISDSDSDATIEPPDYTHDNDSSSFDQSQDLFDTTSGSSSFNKSGNSFSFSLHNSSPKPKPNTLLKKKSRAHEMSDSDSDCVDAGTLSDHAVDVQHSNKLTHSQSHKQFPRTSSATSSNLYSAKKLTLSPKSSSTTSNTKCKLQKERSCPTSSPKSRASTTSSDCSVGCDGSKETSMQPGTSGMVQYRGGVNGDNKPVCKYGDRCFRTNPVHFQDFHHEKEKGSKRKGSPEHNTSAVSAVKKRLRPTEEADTSRQLRKEQNKDGFNKTVADVFSEFQPLSFFLTKVHGIDDRFNNTGAVNLKDILSPLMGNLQASCQFNYMFDIPWLVKQYPKQFRDKPMLLVHGEQGRNETELKEDGAPFPHISFCRAKLEMMYGTHHTKMMLLLYDCGMRVVIHTSNLLSNDWHQKTQGAWISPLFPKLPDAEEGSTGKTLRGDSVTKFKSDMLAYLAAYRVVPLTAWERHIQQHDFSSASVYLIGSIPGRHLGNQKTAWGHLKLRKVLQETGPKHKNVGSWPVIGQFSSIGSLGATPDQWLCDEWLGSLSQCQGVLNAPLHHSKLQLMYPSKENVRLCLEGYGGGGCLPYSIKTARKQIYLNNFVRKWGSEGRGRTRAIPHIKTYTRVSPDYTQAAWFLVTSANLSKAAWGALEKQKTQLMIRSYEIGVLFLPKHFGNCESFPVAKTADEVCESDRVVFPFPYDLPPPTYQKGDRIWMWDVPCVDLPDTHGKKYCPQL